MENVIRKEKPLIAFAFTALVGVSLVSNINQVVAGNDNQNVNFNVNVNSNCTLQSPVAVAFGAYDPVVINASNPLDATGSFDIKCNKGSIATLSIGSGLNPAGPNRRMKSAGTDFLTYNLYTTTGRTTIWNTTNTVTYTATSGSVVTETVYGRIPGAQVNAVAGSYTDIVVVTATF